MDRIVDDVDHTGSQRSSHRNPAGRPQYRAQLDQGPPRPSVAWSKSFGILRRSRSVETKRIVAGGGPGEKRTRVDETESRDPVGYRRGPDGVPGDCGVERLAALAEHSGNSLVAIGYDCIPVSQRRLGAGLGAGPVNPLPHCDQALTSGGRNQSVGSCRVSGFCRHPAVPGPSGSDIVACPLPAQSFGPDNPTNRVR